MEEIEKYHFFRELIDLPFVEKIFLYGSRAKGVHNDRSDIDLAILCPQATDQDWNRILEIIDKADTLLKVDCVRFDQIMSEKFKQSILKDNILLYQRNE